MTMLGRTQDVNNNINVKKTFIKTVIGDMVAHLKPQKFTVLSDL